MYIGLQQSQQQQPAASIHDNGSGIIRTK